MKKAIIYARYSSDSQTEQSDFGENGKETVKNIGEFFVSL